MIAIASDHAAVEFKQQITDYLAAKGVALRDLGTHGPASVDYCDFAFKAAEAVASGECELGLLFCGTGVGMAISANKVKGVRAVVCSEPYSAKLSRQHNNANVLCLGARVVGIELAKMIIDIWLETEFEGGRHANRVNKIIAYEQE
jgi:ribose 5-phosphate isomerase B